MAFRQQSAKLDQDRAELNDAAVRLAGAQEVADAARSAAVEAEQRAVDRQRAVEAELAEVRSGTAWRTAREVSRLASQIARVRGWVLRNLISQTRFRQQVRAQRGAEAAATGATSSPPVQPPSPRDAPSTALAPDAPTTTAAPEASTIAPVLDARTTAPASSLNFRREPVEVSRRTSTLGRLSLLEERGHRPPLPAAPERPEDWPLVSVVVTSFNYGQFVLDAVESSLLRPLKI